MKMIVKISTVFLCVVGGGVLVLLLLDSFGVAHLGNVPDYAAPPLWVVYFCAATLLILGVVGLVRLKHLSAH
jgi:hypothetical protein